MIEEIINKGKILAIIVSNNIKKEGIDFVTPNEMFQQVALMNHPKGKVILPHIHNKAVRKVERLQEVLIINKGKIRVDFYDNKKKYLKSRVLSRGNIIILVEGGHGFECIEDLEMIEVKQGPFVGNRDKTRFDPIDKNMIKK